MSEKKIEFYSPRFHVFDNFSSFQINWQDNVYPTNEHAYQSAKFLHSAQTNPEAFAVAEEIRTAPSPYEALHLARQHSDAYDQEEWNALKVDRMRSICEQKLFQHAIVGYLLYKSDGSILVENSPTDTFWGIGRDGSGKNSLGLVWMNLREQHWDELPKQNPYPNPKAPLSPPDQI